MNNKVSIGSTTIVGWSAAFLALLPTIFKAVEEGQVAFAGPEKYLAIFGIASALVTQIARYLQAHKLIGMNVAADVEQVGSSTVKSIVNEVVKLVKDPIATLENPVSDEELAHDIDNIATGTPGPADGDNSKLESSPVPMPEPSNITHVTPSGTAPVQS